MIIQEAKDREVIHIYRIILGNSLKIILIIIMNLNDKRKSFKDYVNDNYAIE